MAQTEAVDNYKHDHLKTAETPGTWEHNTSFTESCVREFVRELAQAAITEYPGANFRCMH